LTGLPTCLHQKTPDIVPEKAKKSQIVVLRHIYIKGGNVSFITK